MKRLLITGKNGYIARQFEEFIRQFPKEYGVTSVSLRGDDWHELDLSRYDVILHTAGIAHIRETPENAHSYYEVNRDLTIELAEKAKSAGVKQFVFLSTVSVYGMDEGVITQETVPNPVTHYGRSKLQAEKVLRSMDSGSFAVAIVRPPMVYGDGCKGNYQALVKLARILTVFASYENRRSLIRIDRLVQFLRRAIDERLRGVYLPQDPGYSCTSRMIQRIAEENGKKLPLTPLLNPVVYVAKICTKKGKKAFGSLIYEGDVCVEGF